MHSLHTTFRTVAISSIPHTPSCTHYTPPLVQWRFRVLTIRSRVVFPRVGLAERYCTHAVLCSYCTHAVLYSHCTVLILYCTVLYSHCTGLTVLHSYCTVLILHSYCTVLYSHCTVLTCAHRRAPISRAYGAKRPLLHCGPSTSSGVGQRRRVVSKHTH
jgi:hypothetical protein